MAELVRQSLSDVLTERVLQLIRDEGLRPGDRLPAARALAVRFAVATPTLREALRRLQATGAVEIRHGSGVYVSAAMGRIVLPNPHLAAVPGERLRQLYDARLLMEPHLAGLAAARKDPAQLAALHQVLDAASGPEPGPRPAGPLGPAELAEVSLAFHQAVATASGNCVLSEIIDALLHVDAIRPRVPDDRAEDHDQHRAVLAAIESGDAERASQLMRGHLNEVKRMVLHHARIAPHDHR